MHGELCEHARQEAFDLLIQHAEQIGTNAIISTHYDTTELMESVTEVLAYTARQWWWRKSEVSPSFQTFVGK